LLLFNPILESVGIDPRTVVVLRHSPVERPLRKILPWIAAERPDLFLAYQQTQWVTLERVLHRAKIMASFIGHESGRAVFVGLFGVGTATPLTFDEYWSLPANIEL